MPRLTLALVALISKTVFAATPVDPALLEFLGASTRLAASGIDVDGMVRERLSDDAQELVAQESDEEAEQE